MPRNERGNKRKSWVFTINNYTEEEHDRLRSELPSSTKYFIIGEEIGEEGTPHLQGYITMQTGHTFSQVKDVISQRAFIEPAKGTGADNRAYCSKGGKFTEGGVIPRSTIRRDRDSLALEWRERIQQGRSGVAKFADDNPGVYAWSGHTLLRNSMGLSGAIPRPDIHVEWVWGLPGVGKSRYAHEKYEQAYIKDPRTKWWNGYLMEKEVIIDDFGEGGIDINHLLRWFDRYKCYVEVKGDMCPLMADKFIVTSNFHPDDVYQKDGISHKQISALLRRIVINEMK